MTLSIHRIEIRKIHTYLACFKVRPILAQVEEVAKIVAEVGSRNAIQMLIQPEAGIKAFELDFKSISGESKSAFAKRVGFHETVGTANIPIVQLARSSLVWKNPLWNNLHKVTQFILQIFRGRCQQQALGWQETGGQSWREGCGTEAVEVSSVQSAFSSSQ